MAYEWKENQACKATYAILENLMDQFEEALIPFAEAGSYKVENMASYPDDASPKIKEKWAKHFSAKFIQYVLKFYDVKKEREDDTIRKWYDDTWPVFKNGKKTLTHVAEVLDKHCKFNDE